MQVSLDLACCYGSKQDICLKQIQLTRDYCFITPIYDNDACCKHRMTYTLFLLVTLIPSLPNNLVLLSAPLINVNETFINYACFAGHFIPNHLDLTLYEIQTLYESSVLIILTKRLQNCPEVEKYSVSLSVRHLLPAFIYEVCDLKRKLIYATW